MTCGDTSALKGQYWVKLSVSNITTRSQSLSGNQNDAEAPPTLCLLLLMAVHPLHCVLELLRGFLVVIWARLNKAELNIYHDMVT